MDKDLILTESIKMNTFSVNINKDNIYLFTLSDLHIGLGNIDYIKQIINFISNLDNAYVVIGGDLIDNPTKSSIASPLEDYLSPNEQIKYAVELLTPIKDKVLAIIDGNHENRTEKECYISITQMIATMLGISDKYKKELAIGYISVNNNCYIYVDLHKHRKTKNYYDFYNADVLVLEHTHEYNYIEKPIIYHNKITRNSSVRTTYIINNGSALAFPSYAKKAGYALQSIGTYVVELSGIDHNRNIKIWKDVDIIDAIERGYK